MYNPKIYEELIPDLYRIAKAKGIKMTHLVNMILSEGIANIKVEKQIIKEKVEIKKEIYSIQGISNECSGKE